jgi:hypothetical protein
LKSHAGCASTLHSNNQADKSHLARSLLMEGWLHNARTENAIQYDRLTACRTANTDAVGITPSLAQLLAGTINNHHIAHLGSLLLFKKRP